MYNDGNLGYNGKYLYCDAQGKILKGSHTIGNYSFTADESGNIYSSTLNNVPYYNQKDGRWGNQYIGGYTVGSTGCVVMAATSIVNYFTGSNYSPLDLANLLHSEGYYNSSMEGTKSSVWKFIANKFGLTYQNNLSKQDAEKALKEGKIVTGAVGYSQWCPYIGYTHEIFMTGYNNGTTYIFDPLHSDKCGNASISSVFAVLSTEIEDLRDNGPLFAIGKNTISVINTGLADKGTIVIGDQAYTGNPVTTKPIVGIYQNGSYIQLTEGKDYSVSFANNTKAGEATVTVTGKGLYKGTLSKAFYIVNNTIANATYTLSSSGNGSLVLDVTGASKYPGAKIQIYSNNENPAQQFLIERQKNGYYTIKNKNSGLYLTSSSQWQNVCNGLVITQQQLRNDKSSYWMIRSTAKGYIISSAWNSEYVLDVQGAIFKNGSKIQLCSCKNNPAQLWNLNNLDTKANAINELAAANVKTIDDGIYSISSNINKNKVLDIKNGSGSNGANVQLYERNDNPAQLFQVSHVGNFIRITNVGSGKVLDVDGGQKKSGTNVQQYAWTGSKGQLWIAVSTKDGIKLVSALDQNLVLDLNNGWTSNGTNIKIYSDHNSSAQRWTFNKYTEQSALEFLAKNSKNYVKEGVYEIHSVVNESYNLDAINGDKKNGANVQIYLDNNSKVQHWIVSFDTKGFALIQNENSGKYLSIEGNKAQSGVNIVQSDLVNENQKWIFTSLNGAVQIVSALNKDYVVDLSGAHSINGRNIQLYANNGTKAQQWRFVNTKFSNSSLAYKWVPASKENYTVGREGCEITNITIHHMDGKATAESCGAVFQNPNHAASAHYGIGYNGEICQYVDEKDTAWANANWESNKHSVTIENSDWTLAPNYVISDATINSLIRHVADIAARNNIGKLVYGHNINVHGDIVATSCPGPYLREKLPDIILSSNKLNGFN